jgi:hypothetical protein
MSCAAVQGHASALAVADPLRITSSGEMRFNPIHQRTTNPIESTFATVRHRTKITRGPGSRTAGLAMAFKLIEAAQDRWRAVNAPHLVALVRAGAVFEGGKLVERPDEHTKLEAA